MNATYVTCALQMPSNYVLMDVNEMEYTEGGFSISKTVFKYTVTAVITAGCLALGGGLSVAGLKTVLASYSARAKLVSLIVKGVGKLGIAAGNALSGSGFAGGLISCIYGDFVGNIFDKYIDKLDGKKDKKIKIW